MKAHEFLSQGICRGQYAVDAQGHVCSSRSPNAVAWCLEGAIRAAYPDYLERQLVHERVRKEIQNTTTFQMIHQFNDFSPDEKILSLARRLDV